MQSHPTKTPLIPASWLRVLLFLLAYLILSISAYRVLNANISVIHSIEARLANISGNTSKDFTLVALTLLISFLLSVLLVTLFTKFVDRRDLSSLGFAYRGHFPDAMVGILLPVIILGSVSLILYFTRSLEWNDIRFDSGDFLNGLFLMIVIAVGEEMVFRGYILNNLMQSLNRWLSLAISAALFALMHSNNPGVDIIAMMNLFIGGLLLGINYIFTRNLWFSIFMHTLWNFLQGPILGFAVSGIHLQSILEVELTGSPLLTGGDFGLEASLLTGILLIITLLILYLVYQQRNQRLMIEGG